MLSAVADLRYGLRSLKSGRTASFFITLLLSLGIGLLTATVTTAGATLLAPLEYRDPDRLVAGLEYETGAVVGNSRLANGATLSQLYTLRTQVPAFAAVGAFALEWPQPVVSVSSGARSAVAATVSANLFAELGIVPALGRLFDATDDNPGAFPTVIVSHTFWQRYLGQDSSVVGRLIKVEDVPTRIVGVLKQDQHLPMSSHLAEELDIWRPLSAYRTRWKTQPSLSRPDFQIIARLQPDAGIVQAQAQAAIASHRTWMVDPTTEGFSLVLTPFHDFIVGDTRTPVLLLLLSGVAVVGLAVANTLAIVLVGVTAHRQEAAIRHALGAGALRVLGPRVYPVLVLVAISGAIGLGLAAVAVKVLSVITPREYAAGQAPQLTAFSVLIGIAVTVGIAAALAAAMWFHGTRELVDSSANIARAGASVARWPRQTTQALIVIEVALTVVFLANAGLLLRSLHKLLTTDPGFHTAATVVARVRLTHSDYHDPSARREVATELQKRLGALTNVSAAAIATATPLDEGSMGLVWAGDGNVRDTALVTVAGVSDALFAVLGIRLLRGRSFSTAANDPPSVAVVNDVLARKYFSGSDAVGQHLMLGGERFTIIGVVASTATLSLAHERLPQVYLPLQDDSLFQFSLVARARGAPAGLLPVFRRLLNEVDPHIALDRVTTMSARLAESSARNRYYTLIITTAGVIALALAAGGIYGSVAYSAERRTRELAIRIAVGATPGDVLRAAVGWIAAPLALGTAIGLLGLYWTTPLLTIVLFHEPPLDPWPLGGMLALILCAATLATLIPGIRVRKIDPARVLSGD